MCILLFIVVYYCICVCSCKQRATFQKSPLTPNVLCTELLYDFYECFGPVQSTG